MRKPILIAAMIAAFAAPAFADELTLEDVRAMSDDELYALADTLSSEDEARLYEEARSEFPAAALGLQSAINKLKKSQHELEACQDALETQERSNVRSLTELEPGIYFSLLRIVSTPSDHVMDMTVDERTEEATIVGRNTNGVLRDFRICKRAYRKQFGSD